MKVTVLTIIIMLLLFITYVDFVEVTVHNADNDITER